MEGGYIMAIEKYNVSGALQLILVTGQDDEGQEIKKSRTYGNVREVAEDEAVYDVGMAIAGLQKHSLQEVRRRNVDTLINV